MHSDITRGAIYLLVGEFFLAVMVALIKKITGEVSQIDMVFFRNLFGLFALLPVIYHHRIESLKTRRFGLHAFRATVGLSGMYLYFYVIGLMPLAEAILVKLTVPFILPLITWAWLGEKITTRTAITILVGFMGVIFVLRPGADTFQPVALLGLLASFFQADAKVSIRKMSATEPGHRIVFYFGLIATVVSAIPFLWSPSWPQGEALYYLMAIGITATIGQLCITHAYKIANPGQVGPYTYSCVIYAAVLGWIFWGETLLITTFVGSALIVAAGLFNLRKEPVKEQPSK